MDDQRFDRLARRAASGVGRRGVLRGLVAGAAAIVFGGSGFRRGLAQETCAEPCRQNEVCSNGACVRGCRQDRECKDDNDACIGGLCDDGICVQYIVDCAPGHLCCGNGKCCPVSCQTDIDCFTAITCSIGRCGTEGVCEFSQREPCITCGVDGDCAGSGTGAVCCGGTCIAPCPAGFVLAKGCECHGVNSTGSANGTIVVNNAAGTSGSRGGTVVETGEPASTPEPAPAPLS
ncbi:MAG: hypothetical protein M3509_00005 [Chloroflexota bacterium]|nr:hypothetical protein [Chloroflexota bacterium]